MEKYRKYRFSFGPWNIHSGADVFGPAVRKEFSFREKIKFYKKLGFEGVQFHDDDVVPELNEKSHSQIARKAKEVRKILDDEGLEAEFVAPRLWEDPRTIDGGYTANDITCRRYALERSKISIDIARILGTRKIVLWLAREGTYIREAKDPKVAVERIVKAINIMLEYDKKIRVLIEPKPNEPMDTAFIPTAGHAIALAFLTKDPSRVGVNVESAHAILAGLDPSEEMAFALAYNKLWTVHLNDQNGLKFDEDKSFGSVNLRRAFNQVWVLEKGDYGKNGEFVGLDVKAMRTQKKEVSLEHLRNSKRVFLALLDVVRSLDERKINSFIKKRNYEGLDFYISQSLLKI